MQPGSPPELFLQNVRPGYYDSLCIVPHGLGDLSNYEYISGKELIGKQRISSRVDGKNDACTYF